MVGGEESGLEGNFGSYCPWKSNSRVFRGRCIQGLVEVFEGANLNKLTRVASYDL
jgi:hypothetical protein